MSEECEKTKEGFKLLLSRVRSRLETAMQLVEDVVAMCPEELENSLILNKYDSRTTERYKTKNGKVDYQDELHYVTDVLLEWIVEVGLTPDEPNMKEWKLRTLTNALSWVAKAEDQARYIKWDTKERFL